MFPPVGILDRRIKYLMSKMQVFYIFVMIFLNLFVLSGESSSSGSEPNVRLLVLLCWIVTTCRALTLRTPPSKPFTAMLLFTSLNLYAQTQPTQATRPQSVPGQISANTALRFEALSVKPTVPSANPLEHRQIRNIDPTRVHYVNVGLRSIIMSAFDLTEFQVIGPDSLNTIAVDVDATMEAGTTKEQLQMMFRNMLAERFGLTFHWGTKDLPTYSILVARGGPRMSQSADLPSAGDSAPPAPMEGPPRVDSDGFPVSMGTQRDGVQTVMINGRSQLRGRHATMQNLADELSKTQLALPVSDDTGLKAKFDFILKFATPTWSGRLEDIPELGIFASAYEKMEPLPELAGALQSQLGLKLEHKRTPTVVFVVDHVETTPTPN
jgi:uncharacterized protein (TIGR03435 family)